MALTNKILAGLAAATMASAVAAPALAAVSYPGGGTWSYGTRGSGTEVYSNYHHPSVTHRASTINAWGEYSCTTATKGNWAYNSQRAKPGAVDRSYWATKACGA